MDEKPHWLPLTRTWCISTSEVLKPDYFSCSVSTTVGRPVHRSRCAPKPLCTKAAEPQRFRGLFMEAFCNSWQACWLASHVSCVSNQHTGGVSDLYSVYALTQALCPWLMAFWHFLNSCCINEGMGTSQSHVRYAGQTPRGSLFQKEENLPVN